MKKVLIAAQSDNRVIGKENDLLWDMPADQEFFKKQIQDCFLLTGRASYESTQGRDIFSTRDDFVVLTRQPDYRTDRGLVSHSIEEAFEKARWAGADRLCILGGSQVYEQTIDRSDALIITEIHEEFEGDAFFPEIDPAVWKETYREDHLRDEQNPHDYSFVYYERR